MEKHLNVTTFTRDGAGNPSQAPKTFSSYIVHYGLFPPLEASNGGKAKTLNKYFTSVILNAGTQSMINKVLCSK